MLQKKSCLTLVMVILLTFSVSLPVPAEEMPLLPMAMMGQVLDSSGKTVTDGVINIYIDYQKVGSGIIQKEGFTAAVDAGIPDIGKALIFKVIVSETEYSVKTVPADLTYTPGDTVWDMVLTLDTPTSIITSGNYTCTVTDETAKTAQLNRIYSASGTVVIPSVIEGYTITSIGNTVSYANIFVSSPGVANTSVTSLTIPDCVTSIGDYAFGGCSGLYSAYFYGNSPITFGKNVFLNTSTEFNIYYIDGKSGWTNPTWTSPSGDVYDTATFAKLGDVNGDNLLNILDVVKTIDLILDKSQPTIVESCVTDVNNDDVINVLDVIKLVNIILNIS